MNIKQISVLFFLSFLMFWGCNQPANEGSTDTNSETATETETAAPGNKKRENAKIPKTKTVFSHASEADPGKKMTIVEYNEAGHIIHNIDYDFVGSGDILEEETYEYDASGKKTKAIESSFGTTTTTLYTYNDAGHTVKEEWSTNKGDAGSYDIEQNEQGKPVKLILKDKDGTVVNTIVYEYEFNAEGKVTMEKRKEIDAEGTETLDYHVTKAYNEMGKLSKENIHDHKTGEVITSETFTYDERGNEIENKEFDHDGKMIQRLTSEYNDYGELTKDEAFDSEGTRDFWTEYTYDENGSEISRMANDQYGDKSGEKVTVEYW